LTLWRFLASSPTSWLVSLLTIGSTIPTRTYEPDETPRATMQRSLRDADVSRLRGRIPPMALLIRRASVA
jgi:hypothetical protein